MTEIHKDYYLDGGPRWSRPRFRKEADEELQDAKVTLRDSQATS